MPLDMGFDPYTTLGTDPAGMRALSLLNLDACFAGVSSPIILNHIDYMRPNYKEELQRYLYLKAGELEFTAACECGVTAGNMYLGMTCAACGTLVVSDMEAGDGVLEHRCWLEAPEQTPAFLHPIAYLILARWLRYGKRATSYLDTILDPKAPLPPELENVVTGRGHRYLYDNFDRLMEYFLHHHTKTRSKPITEHVELWLTINRSVIFTRHLSVLASALHPILQADTSPQARKTVDPASQAVLDAANELSYLKYSPTKIRDPMVAEQIVYNAYKVYIAYIQDIIDRRMSKKRSLLRAQILGVRFHWSFRAVITPICESHDYDELVIPWCIAVNTLKAHIIAKLHRKHKLTMMAAVEKHARAVLCFDPLIHQVITELIREYPPSPAGRTGIPVLFNRNPSLKRGSIQMQYVRQVKTDVDDVTIGISTMVIAAMNADFDGDSLNGLMILETEAANALEILHPAHRILDINSMSTSTEITLSKPARLVWAAFLGMV